MPDVNLFHPVSLEPEGIPTPNLFHWRLPDRLSITRSANKAVRLLHVIGHVVPHSLLSHYCKVYTTNIARIP